MFPNALVAILAIGFAWIVVAGVVGYFVGGWLRNIADRHYPEIDE